MVNINSGKTDRILMSKYILGKDFFCGEFSHGFSLAHHEDLILPEIFIATFLLMMLKRQSQTW